MKSLLELLLLVIILFTFSSAEVYEMKYQCLPCGQECDKEIFDNPGKCPHCQMELVKSSTIVFKNIEPGKLCDYAQKHPNVILLDVRTKEEFEGKADPDFGSLKNAINVPIQELTSRLKELEKYKNYEIIVYCSHSHRSPQAAYRLTQNGFGKVFNMNGGMSVLGASTCKK